MSSDVDWSCDGGKKSRPQSDIRGERHNGKEMFIHLRLSCKGMDGLFTNALHQSKPISFDVFIIIHSDQWPFFPTLILVWLEVNRTISRFLLRNG